MMIRVLIVDDQKIMCEGLKVILNSDQEIDVISIAANGDEAIQKYMSCRPDVVLMDIRMPVKNGVEAVKGIMKVDRRAKILMLTTFDDEEYIVEAIGNGAVGYILKDIEPKELIKTIKVVYSGNPVMSMEIVQTLAKKAMLGAEKIQNAFLDSKVHRILTERELQVATMVAKGFNNKQIASALHITEGTVKNHVSAIYSKLDIDDRTRLAVFIQEQGV